jgi:hypothetical protein
MARMGGFMIRVLSLAAVVALAPLTGAAPALSQGSSCDQLRDDYARTVKPKLSRVVSRNPTVANMYLKNLNAIQKGENPTPAELDAAHRKTLAGCDKQTGAASCRTFANEMLTAAKLSYDVNKKWALAGCPGTLTASKKSGSDN